MKLVSQLTPDKQNDQIILNLRLQCSFSVHHCTMFVAFYFQDASPWASLKQKLHVNCISNDACSYKLLWPASLPTPCNVQSIDTFRELMSHNYSGSSALLFWSLTIWYCKSIFHDTQNSAKDVKTQMVLRVYRRFL